MVLVSADDICVVLTSVQRSSHTGRTKGAGHLGLCISGILVSMEISSDDDVHGKGIPLHGQNSTKKRPRWVSDVSPVGQVRPGPARPDRRESVRERVEISWVSFPFSLFSFVKIIVVW